MWSLRAPKPETEFERVQRASARPISAPRVMAIRTPVGVENMSERPNGRYSFTNPDIVNKNRVRQIERFNKLVNQLEIEGPRSGIRVIQRGEHATITTSQRQTAKAI